MYNAIVHSPPFLFLTQSLWRDEAYSILISQKPIFTYLHLSFEPPLYYIFLHVWMRVFGTSEIAVRSLSLVAFLIAIFYVGKLAKKIYGSSWLSTFLPICFFLNPMLFYYAFEARAYGWYLAFTVLSTYAYVEKKWLMYVAATVLGLYTHAYMVFVIGVQCIHYVVTHIHARIHKTHHTVSDRFLPSVIGVGILYIPWIVKMYTDIPRLKQSWYFPVDTQLFKSVLGNIFLGYEGTPWNLWIFMQRVSFVLIVCSLIAIFRKKDRSFTYYFFLLLYVPLITILAISVYKPLYVMRYMIPATVAEVFLITAAIASIKNQTIQKIIGTLLCTFLVGFSFWFAPNHKKPDIRSVMAEINTLQRKQDAIFVDDALILYEAMYYNTSPTPIYWYNPNRYSFPWYIGDFILQKGQNIAEIPPYPYRAFLIHLNGTYEIVYNAPITTKIVNPVKK